eukprot:gene3986-4616_t
MGPKKRSKKPLNKSTNQLSGSSGLDTSSSSVDTVRSSLDTIRSSVDDTVIAEADQVVIEERIVVEERIVEKLVEVVDTAKVEALETKLKEAEQNGLYLESQLREAQQENRLLNERIKVLENNVDQEKKKLHRTFGTIRRGTKQLTIRLGHDDSVSSILKDLNTDMENIDEATVDARISENANALLHQLNSFQPAKELSTASTEPSAAGDYNEAAIARIVRVQAQVRRWLALQKFKKLKTKRWAVGELFETESTYVSHLTNMIKIFVNPLRQRAQAGETIIGTAEIDNIFSTVATIVKSNSIFLNQMEDIYKNFNKWSQIGGRMLEQLPLFESYIEYVINYEFSHASLKRSLATVPAFAAFVKAAENHTDLENLDLNDLLIMPVQRIPRYIMLIQQVRKYTPPSHPDHVPLSRALDAFKKFADGINERKGMRLKVLQLEDRISGYKDDLTSRSRYLIREGALRYKRSTEHVFLFNDMLMICHPSLKKIKKSSIVNTSSPTLLDTPHIGGHASSSSLDTINCTYKFLAKFNLDARVKIVEDPNDPKFSTIVPDHQMAVVVQ